MDTAWLNAEAGRLLEFGAAARLPGRGFGWLDGDGRVDEARNLPLWITARMTHVFALGHTIGHPGAGELVDHGVAALAGPFRDPVHDGWYAELTPEGTPAVNTKAAYEHAFVVLAVSSASAVGRPGAAELFADACRVMAERFWSAAEGRCVEQFREDWSEPEKYRGANSNMHAVEAFLAAADVSGDPVWRQRALSIADHLINEVARAHAWRLPEHFDPSWSAILEYNVDSKGDQFRPYGSTIGHWMEWARLLLHLDAALETPPNWLTEAARELFGTAVRVGWSADGSPGFVYTVDWDDMPVVRERMHWVIAEAIAAASALATRTGDSEYVRWYETFWDYARTYVIDQHRGSWHHELDDRNRPSATVWQGKPDIYHAVQASLLPQVPLAPTLSLALKSSALKERAQ